MFFLLSPRSMPFEVEVLFRRIYQNDISRPESFASCVRTLTNWIQDTIQHIRSFWQVMDHGTTWGSCFGLQTSATFLSLVNGLSPCLFIFVLLKLLFFYIRWQQSRSGCGDLKLPNWYIIHDLTRRKLVKSAGERSLTNIALVFSGSRSNAAVKFDDYAKKLPRNNPCVHFIRDRIFYGLRS